MAKTAFTKNKSFHKQTGLKFKGQSIELLHLKHSCVW